MHRATAVAVVVLLCAAAPALGSPIFTLEALNPNVPPGGTIDIHVVGSDFVELNLVQIELEISEPVASVVDGDDIFAGSFFAGEDIRTFTSRTLPAVIIRLSDRFDEVPSTDHDELAVFRLTIDENADPNTSVTVELDQGHTFFEDGNDDGGRVELPLDFGAPLKITIVPEPTTATVLVLGLFACLLRRGQAAA